MSTETNTDYQPPVGRLYAAILLLLLCSTALIARAVVLQVVDTEFLQEQGEARYLREVEIPTTRGNVTDRNGEPLAVSTPVDSIAVNPRELLQHPEMLVQLADVLGVEAADVERKLMQRSQREFAWLQRRLHPDVAAQIRALDAPGVFLRKEYRRYYPAAQVAAHLVGFTNIDDIGQEGLELAYNDSLSGSVGSKRVVKNGLGRVVEEVELIKEARPGSELRLTIDRRLQYLAYRELKRSILEHGAQSGSVVLLDVKTGEVLTMVNFPSYNPNNITRLSSDGMRNRAVTDVFEPGSVIKAFAVAAALETGRVTPSTLVDTSPGEYEISGYKIHDVRDYGVMDVTKILTKSSNIGVTKLVLDMDSEHLWRTYHRFGFGEVTGSGFPGESAGILRAHHRWRRVEQATLSYGYGLSVTPLQLAQAYAAIADDGKMRTPVYIYGAHTKPVSVIDPTIANQVKRMLETVPGPDGTGKRARVKHYRVAGKTGTSRKASAAGYASRYVASFAGFAPVSDPQLVAVVVVNDPSGEEYYGGQVAAPLFSRVMENALRILNIPPDDYSSLLVQQQAAGGSDEQ